MPVPDGRVPPVPARPGAAEPLDNDGRNVVDMILSDRSGVAPVSTRRPRGKTKKARET